ncbi:MAG: insulinase family protein [Methanoregulaceae archaeon]|nr:insulinase family protein [Methanoregulaceae archaeon]
MTWLSILLALGQAGPPMLVSEVTDPAAKSLRVEIVAGIPTSNSRERAMADVLGPAIVRGTMAYPRANLLAATSRGGQILIVRAMADHLRIGFSLAPRDFDLAVQLCDELIREALISQDATQRILDELPFRSRSAWAMAWFPGSGEARLLNPADVKFAYRRTFTPGNVSIAIGGNFIAGEFRRRLGERFEHWRPVQALNPRSRFQLEPPVRADESFRGNGTLAALDGPVVPVVSSVTTEASDRPTLPLASLAVAMVGLGKASAAYETVRETLGQSYRQEAALVPDGDGLRPVLAWVSTKPDVEAARQALLKRIDAWNQQDIDLARAKLGQFADLAIPLSPWLFNSERPLTNSLEDRTFIQAYWRMKTGRAWTTPDTASVTLDAVKSFATEWIREAQPRVIAGR